MQLRGREFYSEEDARAAEWVIIWEFYKHDFSTGLTLENLSLIPIKGIAEDINPHASSVLVSGTELGRPCVGDSGEA